MLNNRLILVKCLRIIRILNKYNYKNLSPQQKAEIYQWNGINDRQLSEELVSKIWGLVLKHLKIEFKDAYVLNAGSGRFWDYSPTLISLNKPKDEKTIGRWKYWVV